MNTAEAIVAGTIANLESKCTLLREELVFRKLATDAEIAALWPGGESNKGSEGADSELSCWIYAFANLLLLRKTSKEEAAGAATRARDEAEEEVLKALDDSPEIVTLPVRDGDQYLTVAVYPKSYVTLDFMASHDARIEWLVGRREKVRGSAMAIAPDLLDRAGQEIAFQYGLLCWVATHEGPGLPFPPRETPDELPQWVSALSPKDLHAIHSAFVKVNLIRLHLLYSLLGHIADDGNAARPSWTTFFALRSEDTGVPASVLMRDRSLGSQIAQALIVAEQRLRSAPQPERAA